MIDRATKYAEKVAEGKILAGKAHIEACKRHLLDLSRQGNKDFPYIWVPDKSDRILRYGEMLTIAEGAAPKPVHLQDFQCFDLGVPMGWINKDTGFRRFRRKYKSVARQNGKTFENGITASYIAAFGGYKYGLLFTAATKKRQAKIAWNEIKKFIEADKDLQELFDIKEYISLITAKETKCTIEALSKEAGLDDGFRSIFCSVDEIHQHRDNSIYKALYNGQAALDEALISMITTRGKNLNSFCYEMDSYCLHILDGTALADDFFVDIYCIDKDDDPFDENVWVKANPLLVTRPTQFEQLKRDAQTARDMGGMDLSDFFVKRLNIWYQSGDTQYIKAEDWKKGETDFTLENMRGKECFVGLDLSSGGDLTSLVLEIPLTNSKFFIDSHSFMPSQRLEEHIKTDIAPYDVWANEGLLTITDTLGGIKNDYGFIISYLREIITEYDLKLQGIAYDPHNADGFLSDLDSFGVPLLSVTQSARNLNDTTQDFALEVEAGNILYNKKNHLLTWSITNAKKTKNSFGEIKIDKEVTARHKRIDVADAAIDAHFFYRKAGASVVDYNKAMQDYLETMGWS